MELSPAARIDHINQSAELLSTLEWPMLKLLLKQHGYWVRDESEYDSKYEYVLDSLSDSKDEALLAFHEYAITGIGSGVNQHTPFKSDRLHIFASHLSIHREYVGRVKANLDRYGIELFVAHQSIDVSKEWQQVIEAALSDCHAMVAFLHEGFQESPWCDQEVGWSMGLKRPLMVVSFGKNPHGFPGKFQALNGSTLSIELLSKSIFDWAWGQTTLRTPLIEGLVGAFCNSPSFEATRMMIPLLERVDFISDGQLSRMEQASKINSQLREANVQGQSLPEWVHKFVEERRSSGSTGWADSSPF